MEGASIWI